MRRIIFILFIIYSDNLRCQATSIFETEAFIELCNPKNFDYDERNSGKSIYLLQYYKDQENANDSLEVINLFKIRFLRNRVVQLKSKKAKSKFWKTEFYVFDSKDFVWQCRKNGSLKYDSTEVDNEKIEHYKIALDSIVIIKTFWSSKDSLCMYLDKFVYREGILMEKWHKYAPFEGCDWRVGQYSIESYKVLTSNQKRIDYSWIDKNSKTKYADYYTIITNDSLGNEISAERFKISNPNELYFGYYHTYQDGKLKELKLVENSEVVEVYCFK